jgi:hypothetical protein
MNNPSCYQSNTNTSIYGLACERPNSMLKFLQSGLCADKKLHGVVWNYYLKFIPEQLHNFQRFLPFS